jgi:hypothetical protein
VIPDLARWEDWSVLERLVEMFKTSGSSGYIRPPVVAYLEAASEQPGAVGTRAKAALVELEGIDPEGVKRARATMAFGFLGRARTVEPAKTATEPGATEATATKSDAETAKDQPAAPATGGDGFTASAADAAAAESTNPADRPPNPVEFDRQMTAKEGAGVRPANEQVAAAKADGAAEAAAAPPLAATPAAGVTTPAFPLQTVLVIGLPVGAVVLLVCVFWLILRGGTA